MFLLEQQVSGSPSYLPCVLGRQSPFIPQSPGWALRRRDRSCFPCLPGWLSRERPSNTDSGNSCPMAVRGHRPAVPLLPGVLVQAAPRRQWSWSQKVREELPGRPGESGLSRGSWPGQWASRVLSLLGVPCSVNWGSPEKEAVFSRPTLEKMGGRK